MSSVAPGYEFNPSCAELVLHSFRGLDRINFHEIHQSTVDATSKDISPQIIRIYPINHVPF